MCGRGGNCDGSCEATAVHRHVCPECGDDWLCVNVDCPDDPLCEDCDPRLTSPMSFDAAHPERPRGI